MNIGYGVGHMHFRDVRCEDDDMRLRSSGYVVMDCYYGSNVVRYVFAVGDTEVMTIQNSI